ncbi:acryloyl-CoA reductase [Paenibacillus sp. XY044]|uniref:acrylyl-CoA reductase family protein n=1 Tax=Paenibacillus sp. XY044 TaxID=2026089 RepID=UPI000B996FCD|nr:acryloyl-CoA reductase [Paenibacillus sp. XY044]OZB97881.1 oxidoreductase [Paenibacillus sp. XY044]
MEKFQAFMVRKDENGGFQSGIETLTEDQLPPGDVTIRVHYSGVNYKDGLASLPDGKVVTRYPMVPGIDLAGEVTQSEHPAFKVGDQVLCTGYGVGTDHFGGFSEYARLKGEWLVHLPKGLSMREAMGIGTAGFTAALSVDSLIRSGVTPDSGEVLVTGATGGVGSFAVSMLSRLGYQVTASTGKLEAQKEWLTGLGAHAVVGREDISAPVKGVLATSRWAGVVDPVGGPQLGTLLKSVKYGGGIALSGLTGGSAFDSTVHPFILRGVNLLGIDSVFCPKETRSRVWNLLGSAWKPETALSEGLAECGLSELPDVLAAILRGEAVGRTLLSLESLPE